MARKYILSALLFAAAPAFAATAVSESINPAAQQGKKSQSGGAGANMAASAMLMAACMATQPPNMALCMMGAMAAMQGGHDKDAAGQSGATQMASANGGAGTTNPTKTTYGEAALSEASLQDKKTIQAGMNTLKEAGYTATPAGISSSSGNIPAASFGSSGGMIAAGLDPNQVKDAQKVLEKVNSDIAKYGKIGAVAEGEGSGGGRGPTGEYQPASVESPLAGLGNPFAINDKQKAAMMAGKTVNFDGEPIGVKGDNIFDMVHTAYARKTAGKHFIETDHDPELNTRAPASVPKSLPRK